jgi:hypothetical protein
LALEQAASLLSQWPGISIHKDFMHNTEVILVESGLKQILPQKVPEQDCETELNSAIWCKKNKEKY